MIWIEFFICGALLTFFAYNLCKEGVILSEKTNMEKGLIGMFFLAIATLATMGFSVTNVPNHAPVILADVATCELAPTSLTAIELLDFVDDSCDPGLLDAVELEISRGVSGRISTQTLLDSFGLSGSGGSGVSEYLEIVEVDEVTFVSPSASSGSRFQPFIDYHNPSSPWADVEPVASARSGSRFEGFIDYHNPSSPWADGILMVSNRLIPARSDRGRRINIDTSSFSWGS